MRAPTPTIDLSSTLQPVASPVDTYVRPAAPSRSPLWDVADALGNFDNSLGDLLKTRQEAKAKDQAIIDEVNVYRGEGREAAADAIRNGIIPPNASPVFSETTRETTGMTDGVKLAEKWRLAYLKWPGRNGTDPAALDGFFTTFMRENVSSNDPAYLRGIAPQIEQIHREAYSVYSKDLADNTLRDATTASGSAFSTILGDASSKGSFEPGSNAYDNAWAKVMEIRSRSIAAGMTPEQQDQQLLATIATMAISERDPKLLSLFDKPLAGSTFKLTDTPEGLSLKLETEAKLAIIARQDAEAQAQETARLDKVAKDNSIRSAIESLATDPSKPLPEELLKEGLKHDPEFRLTVLDFQRKLAEGGTTEDPKAVAEVYSSILAGGGMEPVWDAIRNGIIRKPETIKEASGYARTLADDAGGKVSKVLKGGTYDDVLKMIDGMTKPQSGGFAYPDGSPIGTPGHERDPLIFMGSLDPEAISEAGLSARFEYRRLLMDWALRNPNASELEILKTQREIGSLILDHIDAKRKTYTPLDPNGSTEGTAPALSPIEDRASRSGSPSGMAPASADLTLTTPQPEAPLGASPQSLPPAEDLKTFMETSPKSVQDLVNQRATAEGLLPSAVWERVFKLHQEVLGGNNARSGGGDGGYPTSTPDPSSPSEAHPAWTAPQALPMNYAPEITSAIDGALSAVNDLGNAPQPAVYHPLDPQGTTTNGLLAMIGSVEAPAGYNQMYGEKTPSMDLSKLTLDQVLQLQDERVNAGWQSSAVGRYQFLRKTLESLKTGLGLTGSEAFTPELQDKLGMALLERRGLNEFLAGSLSKEAFGNNLAQEWAALPVISGGNAGKSFYEGDGLNHALLSPDQVLNGLSGGQAGSTPSGEVPKAYSKIPPAEVQQFLAWNSDPIANNETNLASIEPKLAEVVRRAQQISSIPFVVGSGKRTEELQAKAMEWGWSKKQDSNHLHGNAADLWAIDKDGAVSFDPKMLEEVSKAMKQAAQELGVKVNWGGDWKSFKDLPHFELAQG